MTMSGETVTEWVLGPTAPEGHAEVQFAAHSGDWHYLEDGVTLTHTGMRSWQLAVDAGRVMPKPEPEPEYDGPIFDPNAVNGLVVAAVRAVSLTAGLNVRERQSLESALRRLGLNIEPDAEPKSEPVTFQLADDLDPGAWGVFDRDGDMHSRRATQAEAVALAAKWTSEKASWCPFSVRPIGKAVDQ